MSAGSFESIIRGYAGSLVRTPTRIAGSVSEQLKRRHCRMGEGSMLLPPSRVENFLHDRDAISVGSKCRIAGQLLVFAHGGRIRIGDDCFIGEGARIWSANSVTIGNRVLISHAVNIHDTNSHSLSAKNRHEQIMTIFFAGHPADVPDVPDAPVVIEDDAWIGFNAVVLKGVRIGRGAVIGAGALISKDVAPFSVMVGNPARQVGTASP